MELPLSNLLDVPKGFPLSAADLVLASLGVYRGGSWYGGAARCRSACRNGDTPGSRCNNLGFRLALGPELK